MRLFKLLIILNIAFVSVTASAADCVKHPIYCKIKSLNPKLSHEFAMTLSNLIYKGAKGAGTDPMVSVAIAMQESSLMNRHRRSRVVSPSGTVYDGFTDIGVFQIHVDTAIEMSLDIPKLINDIEYQVESHFKILKRKVKVCTKKREKLKVLYGLEWSCYHSYTESTREKYIKLVGRYL
jgi:hypothetical protein